MSARKSKSDGAEERSERIALAVHGLPLNATRDKRRALAVQLVRDALARWPTLGTVARVRDGEMVWMEWTRLEWLEDLCERLRVTERAAFVAFTPTEADAAAVLGRRWEAYSVAAFLFLRAGSFGESASTSPTAQQVAALARALRKSDSRRRQK